MTRVIPSEKECLEQADWDDHIKRARNGDRISLGIVCSALRPDLLRTAEGRLSLDLRPKLGASDLVQQSLLEAQRDLQTFQGDTEVEFRAWVKRILEHNLLDATRMYRATQRRDTSREISFHLADGADRIHRGQKTASSLIRRKEVDEELLRAIAQLPEKNRQVIELRHRRGLTHQEIAEELAISELACRKLWSRTVNQLRSMLTKESDESRPRKQR